MDSSRSSRPLELLLVEDSQADVLLTKEALAEARVPNNLHVVDNGEDALRFLHRSGKFSGVPRPDLLLLDLNLPRKNGREVLAEIKQDESLKLIPVIVLTTSRAEEDIISAYGLHANCYIMKPFGFDSFADVVRAIEHFWMEVTALPNRP